MQPGMDRDPEAMERALRRQKRAEQIQRRRLALGFCLVGLIVLILALVIGLSGRGGSSSATTSSTGSSTGNPSSGTYSAELTGAEAVPAVTTSAKGDLILTYDSQKKQLSYVLEITHKMSNPSSATIYQGGAGEPGAAVYVLWTAEQGSQGQFSGILAQGVIVEQDLIGPLAGKTIADLIALIAEGDAYVSVGNPTHPEAIRGQIQ